MANVMKQNNFIHTLQSGDTLATNQKDKQVMFIITSETI
jgi:hypothetical protein